LFALTALGLVFWAIPAVLLFERARTIERFDESGVTLFGGDLLPWDRFRGVRYTTTLDRARRRSVESGVELVFDGGVGALKYQYVRNWKELAPLVKVLESGDVPRARQLLSAAPH
jgi:hypothetical protein